MGRGDVARSVAGVGHRGSPWPREAWSWQDGRGSTLTSEDSGHPQGSPGGSHLGSVCARQGAGSEQGGSVVPTCALGSLFWLWLGAGLAVVLWGWGQGTWRGQRSQFTRSPEASSMVHLRDCRPCSPSGPQHREALRGARGSPPVQGASAQPSEHPGSPGRAGLRAVELSRRPPARTPPSCPLQPCRCDEPHPTGPFCLPMGIFLPLREGDPWASPSLYPPGERNLGGTGVGQGWCLQNSVAHSPALSLRWLCTPPTLGPRAFVRAAHRDTLPPHDALHLIPSCPPDEGSACLPGGPLLHTGK